MNLGLETYFPPNKIIYIVNKFRKRIIEKKYLLSATDMDVVHDLVGSLERLVVRFPPVLKSRLILSI